MVALNNLEIKPTKATVEYTVQHYNAFNAFEGKVINDSKNRDIKHENFTIAPYGENTAAGAVLVTAINAILVGYIVFWDKLSNFSFQVIYKIKHSEPYMILIALIIVVLTVVIVKAIFGEGTPLKGGMPSGHSALAFSISTAIALITEKPICIILSYLMAFITAQSRVDSEVHTVFEVIVGGILGILLTLLIFTIFKL
jgi:diacylglycerol kinase (ATP)